MDSQVLASFLITNSIFCVLEDDCEFDFHASSEEGILPNEVGPNCYF